MHLGCEDGKAAPSSQTDRRNGASTWVLKGQDGELPLAVQSKLLRTLQEGTVTRLGSRRET